MIKYTALVTGTELHFNDKVASRLIYEEDSGKRDTSSTNTESYGGVDASGNSVMRNGLVPHIPTEVHDIEPSTNFVVFLRLRGKLRYNKQ
jgi:hypothetical protein